MEENHLQTIISFKPKLEEKQAELVSDSFHSIAELLLSVIERLEKQEQEEHSYANNQ